MDRWRLATLVSAAIAISYLDRQALPVAIQAVKADIPLTNTEFGALTSVFFWPTRLCMRAAARSWTGSARRAGSP